MEADGTGATIVDNALPSSSTVHHAISLKNALLVGDAPMRFN